VDCAHIYKCAEKIREKELTREILIGQEKVARKRKRKERKELSYTTKKHREKELQESKHARSRRRV
jgi:hypothetical protein